MDRDAMSKIIDAVDGLYRKVDYMCGQLEDLSTEINRMFYEEAKATDLAEEALKENEAEKAVTNLKEEPVLEEPVFVGKFWDINTRTWVNEKPTASIGETGLVEPELDIF